MSLIVLYVAMVTIIFPVVLWPIINFFDTILYINIKTFDYVSL